MISVTRSITSAISNWWRLVWMTMGQLLASYGGGGRFSFIMSLLEPLFLIGAFYLFRSLFRMGGGGYGTSLFLFMASGLLPFYLFLQVSSRASSAVRAGGRFPGLSTLDVYIATTLLNSLIWITMILVIFVGMWLYGIAQARPESIVTCAASLVLLIILAMGVGMINNVIARYFRLWLFVYRIATRGLIFLSGVFFIVDLQPFLIRAWSVANPLSHGIEWFRLGVYGRYPHISLDQSYLIKWAFVALFLGFVLDRAAIRGIERV